ncbi:hypothetical protein [Yoonia sp. 2307UL14-13]|uniref:hypothetical protein n=1 Tax=Yoonia sp. 2307UL14-13 TaxID=3126506 RepID=UPI0030AE637C
MAEFLRPEVRAFLEKWREVIAALAMLILGLWMVLTGVGITPWIGGAFMLVGIGWTYAGVQRVRFDQGHDGPGVVQIRERRLAYFGPLDGGVMDINDITRLTLDPTSHPAPSWILEGEGGQRLSIPVNAAEADDLFDVFAALPGIDTSELLNVLSRTPDARVVIWERTRPLLH